MSASGVFDIEAIQKGLYASLDAGRSFEGRNSYVGVSEVGGCRRLTVYRKLNAPETKEMFDPEQAWRILQGRILEGAVVKILRESGVDLRETGQRQLEVRHSEVALVCHPDGKVLPPFAGLDADAGPGVLEIKTTAARNIKEWKKNGIPSYYQDQIQGQMGLTGRTWALFVAAPRDQALKDGEFLSWWVVDFDPTAYVPIVERAAGTLAIMASGELPEGEPHRAFQCEKCPLAMDCQSYLCQEGMGTKGDLTDESRVEIEALLEELTETTIKWSPLDKDMDRCEKAIKALIPTDKAAKYAFGSGTVGVSLSDRETIDGKGLKAAHPEIHAQFTSSKSSATVRITARKGE